MLGACRDDFVPFNRLDRLRVLAIQGEPAAPAFGEETVLTPLLYLPAGHQVTRRAWSWCPFPGPASAGSPCLLDEAEAGALAAAAGAELPPYDLGDGDTARFEHTLDPGLLASLCAGAADPPSLLRCDGGFPIQIRLVVDSDAGQVVTAVRRLRLRFDESHPPNQNPVIAGLTAMVGSEEVLLGEEPAPDLPREQETEIRARVPAEVAERYRAVDPEGEEMERVERLVLTWFVDSGDTESERTSFIDGVVELEDALGNRWEPAAQEDYPADRARLTVVLRDEREGVTWSTGAVALAVAP
jgi:hypothetical protein